MELLLFLAASILLAALMLTGLVTWATKYAYREGFKAGVRSTDATNR